VVAIATESGTRTAAAGGCRGGRLAGVFLIDPDDEALRILYAVPATSGDVARPFVRANFVTTVDGRLSGPDGTSSSINNAADKRVFDVLRSLADAVVVGAGTARAERYPCLPAPAGGTAPDLVVVSNSGEMPSSVTDSASRDDGVPRGRALLATHAQAPEQPGVERLVCGADSVDPARLLHALFERGVRSVLCEGGPQLLTTLLEAGLVDELALTTAPTLVGAVSDRLLTTAPLETALAWGGGAVIDGTAFALWRVRRSG
jgi:riboflavin biosynthesis pyrimidine reductase